MTNAWSMFLSENRYALFVLMLLCAQHLPGLAQKEREEGQPPTPGPVASLLQTPTALHRAREKLGAPHRNAVLLAATIWLVFVGKGIWMPVIFFQAEDGIRDHCVTGVQTCALPI